MTELELLTTVAVLEDVPAKGLSRGQVGTIVELLEPGVYEVEFIDEAGQTYAMTPVYASQLIKLLHQPNCQAA